LKEIRKEPVLHQVPPLDAIGWHQAVGISDWVQIGECGSVGASAALNVIQHFGIVADEPSQVANVSRTVDRI